MTSESSFSEALIDLVFDKFSTFVEQYSAQVSLAGMYLKTADLKAVGTPVSTEIKLSDGYRLIQAVGEVAWVCPQDIDQKFQQGLAIRFHALDEDGRGLLLKIIEEQVKSGGDPFDIGQPPAGAIVERGQPEVIATAAPPSDAAPTADQPVWAPEEEIVFDAPWGDKLPDLPIDILESELPIASEMPPPPLAAAGRRLTPAPTELPLASSALDREEDTEERAAFSLAAPDIELALPSFGAGDLADPQNADPHDPDLDATAPMRSGPPLTPKSRAHPEQTLQEQTLQEAAETTSDSTPLGSAHPGLAEPSLGDLPPDFELADDAGFAFEEAPEEIDFTQDLSPADLSVPGLAMADAPTTNGNNEISGPDELSDEEPTAPIAPAADPLQQPLAASTIEESPSLRPPRLESPSDALFPDLAPSSVSQHHPAPPPTAATFLGQASSDPVTPPPTETRPAPAGLFDEGPSDSPSVSHEVDEGHSVEDLEDFPTEEETADRPRRRLVPWVIAVVLAMLVGVLYLQRDTLMGLLGRTPAAPQEVPPVATAPPTESLEPDDPLPQAQANLTDLEPLQAADSATAPLDESDVTAAPLASLGTPPPISPPSTPAARIQSILWRSSPAGTKIVIQGDGALPPGRLQHSRLATPSVRELLRISRILDPYQESSIEVGTPELIRIRLGHHPKAEGAELHVVLDLPTADIELTDITPQGDRIEIFLSRPR